MYFVGYIVFNKNIIRKLLDVDLGNLNYKIN